jgi:hypothetical protein
MIVMPNANEITIVIELSPTAVNPETLSSLAVALKPAPYTKALVRHPQLSLPIMLVPFRSRYACTRATQLVPCQ